ncbi:MAG: hypothetical protein V3T86_12635 [Planctomycetota bacterium]
MKPAPTLALYLAIGLLMRVPSVVFAEGYQFVDQQYQYVDPAWHLATGDDWLETHEWKRGMRSWVYPGMLAGVFKAANSLGFEDALWRMTLVRLVHAVFSLLPLIAFWFVVTRWRPIAGARAALFFFACSGALLHTGVQPSGPTFAAGLSVAAVLFFLGPGRWPALLSGLLLGIAFCCRFQDALFGPVLFAAGLFARQPRKCLWLALGFLGPLLLQGLVDLRTWGGFMHSPIEFFRFNVIEGGGTAWATKPFWFYAVVVVAPYVMFVPPFFKASVENLRRGARTLAIPLLAAALYILVLSFISRKSVRFLPPALGLVSAVLAVGLFCEPLRGRAFVHRRVLVIGHVALAVVLSLYAVNRGPVRAAYALGEHPEFTGEVTIVDGNDTDVGGLYYLHRKKINVKLAKRDELAAVLEPGQFVLVRRSPIDPRSLGGRKVELLGSYTNIPDVSGYRRTYLYRIQ